jgi:iron complex outermembrane receptor protein
VFAPEPMPGLRASIANWAVNFKNAVESPQLQFLINNEANFPGRVIRGPSQNGQVKSILSINDTFINLGRTDEAGVDFDVSYKIPTHWGEWTPAISTTATYRYETVVAPGTPAVNAVSAANFTGFAPRWKGLASLGWKPHPALQFTFYGHYVGSYRDYSPLTNGTYQMLGDFWTFDASAKYELPEAMRFSRTHLSGMSVWLGVINATNKLPVFSTYAYYDPTQYDARGRFIYARLEVKL